MLERIYWLYCQLKCNAFPSFYRYAEKYELSRATFKRDLVYLRERLNAQVSFDADRQGYYLTDGSFELPAFWFDPVHLLMMLGVCRQLSFLSDSSDVRRFQERIESLLTIHYGSGVPDLVSYESVQWTGCDARLLEILIRAIRGRHLVRMTYFAAHSGEVTDRRLEPYRLHHYRGTWHLVGYCHRRVGPRVFMLSRIQKLEPLPDAFETPRFDVTAFLENTYGIYNGGAVQEVVLRFSKALARSIRGEIWHRDQEMVDLEDGRLLMTLKVADLTEIGRHVLMYGPDVEVLAPEELRRRVTDAAERLIKMYREQKNRGWVAI